MKRLIPLLLLLAGCNGGGPGRVSTYEEAAEATAKQMQEVAGILGGVKDKATAEAAKPKLEAVAKRLGEIVTAVEKLGPPADVSKTEPTIENAGQALSGAMEAYLERTQSSPEVSAIINAPFIAVSGHLMKLRGMLGG